MGDVQWMMDNELGWLYFLYVLCIVHVVIKLPLATLAWTMLSATAAGDDSQTTPVQNYACYFTQI